MNYRSFSQLILLIFCLTAVSARAESPSPSDSPEVSPTPSPSPEPSPSPSDSPEPTPSPSPSASPVEDPHKCDELTMQGPPSPMPSPSPGEYDDGYPSLPWGSDGSLEPWVATIKAKFVCFWDDKGKGYVDCPTTKQADCNGYCRWTGGACTPRSKLACDATAKLMDVPSVIYKRSETGGGGFSDDLRKQLANYDTIFFDEDGHGYGPGDYTWPANVLRITQAAQEASSIIAQHHGCSVHRPAGGNWDDPAGMHSTLWNNVASKAVVNRLKNGATTVTLLGNQFHSRADDEDFVTDSPSTVELYYSHAKEKILGKYVGHYGCKWDNGKAETHLSRWCYKGDATDKVVSTCTDKNFDPDQETCKSYNSFGETYYGIFH